MRKLHTKSKIFFPNPYVVRIEYPAHESHETAYPKFRKLMRDMYKLYEGTWGYSSLETEFVNRPVSDTVAPVLTISPPFPFSAPFAFDNNEPVLRSYLCFKDESDALMFRLSCRTDLIHVNMWPHRSFTIHEVTDEPPSPGIGEMISPDCA